MRAGPRGVSAYRSDTCCPSEKEEPGLKKKIAAGAQNTKQPKPRVERIKTKSQFQTLLAQPALARTQHFAMHVLDLQPQAQASDGPRLQMGALIPKRWAKRAVTRNAIRRQIYQLAQEMFAANRAQAILIRLRTGLVGIGLTSASSRQLKHCIRDELRALMLHCKGGRA